MAATKLVTKSYTLTSTPTALNRILDFLPHAWVKSVTLRAARSNSGDTMWADDGGGEPGGYIAAGEAVVIDYGDGEGAMQEIKIYGYPGDGVYISAHVNSESYHYERG